jgi:photosystem II stability/assembly factor-like uncharacterized protein
MRHVPAATLLLLALPLLLASLAGAYVLEPAGYGGGGRYTAVAIAPDNPQRVYIGSDVAGFYVSEDAGLSYTPVGNGLHGLAVADIIVPPGRPDAVMVLCDRGLFYSVDRGRSMHLISAKIRYDERFFGSNLLLFAPDGSLYAGSDLDGVFKLTPPAQPDSLEWRVEPLIGLGGSKVNSLAFWNDALHAATDRGVRKWADDHWQRLNKGLPLGKENCMDLVAPQGGPLLTVERYAGVFAYAPDNDRWESIGPNKAQIPGEGPVYFKALACNPHPSTSIFVATHPDYWPRLLLNTTDNGATWKVITRFANTSPNENWATGIDAVETLAFTEDGKLGYLLDWWNAWRSQDGGNSWVQTVTGLQNTVVNDIAFPENDTKSIFLAVADNGLMVTENHGQTWQRRMKDVVDGNAHNLAFSSGSPRKLYMIMEPWFPKDPAGTVVFHLYKSTDMGRSWMHYPISLPRRNFSQGYIDGMASNVVVAPDNDDLVYVATNGYGVLRLDTATQPPRGGYATAESISNGLNKPYVKGPGALLVHPGNPDVLYAGALAGGVYKTQDRGKNWKLLSGTEGFIFGMAMDPANPERLLAAAGGNRVLLTENGGGSWRSLTLPFDPGPDDATYAVAFGQDGKTIFVGTNGFNLSAARGFFVSTDNGKSFKHVETDNAPVGILTVKALPDSPASALVGYNGLGIFMAEPSQP